MSRFLPLRWREILLVFKSNPIVPFIKVESNTYYLFIQAIQNLITNIHLQAVVPYVVTLVSDTRMKRRLFDGKSGSETASSSKELQFYYVCKNGQVLDPTTNRRFFTMSCNDLNRISSLGGNQGHAWPKCKAPTHCIGRPNLPLSSSV